MNFTKEIKTQLSTLIDQYERHTFLKRIIHEDQIAQSRVLLQVISSPQVFHVEFEVIIDDYRLLQTHLQKNRTRAKTQIALGIFTTTHKALAQLIKLLPEFQKQLLLLN